MSDPYIYYKKQCDYCLRKGRCDSEKRTRTFVNTIGGVESLSTGVYGSLSFRCDYFYLNQLAYDKDNPPETCG